MASAAPSDTDDHISVLTFSLEDDRYCVTVGAVASVLGVTDDDPIASAADPWNAGSVSVAGDRVRVVDLPRAFNSATRITTRVDEPKLLVFTSADATGDYYGWLVDDVGITQTADPNALEPTRTSTQLAHVRGRLEIDGEEVVWLDEGAIHG